MTQLLRLMPIIEVSCYPWSSFKIGKRAMKRLASVIGLCLGLAFAAVLASAGNARADYQAGLAAFDAGDYAKAAQEWQAAANTGDARAEHCLGLLRYRGQLRQLVRFPGGSGWRNSSWLPQGPISERGPKIFPIRSADRRGASRRMRAARARWNHFLPSSPPS